MSDTKTKIWAAAIIIFNFAMCVLISAGVYAVSTIVAFGAWHCPPPNQCDEKVWLDLLILLMWLSPFAFFAFGAFVSRPSFHKLAENNLTRKLMFFAFALFPLLALIGLIVYAVKFY